MKKKQIVHIHTDYKFIFLSMFFKGEFFEETIIIIEGKEPYQGIYKNKAAVFKKGEVREIVNMCKKADLVVLYDLDTIKSRIALALPKEVKIAWRFFGYELYAKKRNLFLSEKSIEVNRSNRKAEWIRYFKGILHKIKYGGTSLEIFYKAVNRIDYMLVLSEEEYGFISQYWDLPEFIKLPRRDFSKDKELPDFEVKNKNNKRMVVIGNSRNAYNNHLDVIDLVDHCPNKSQYIFTLLFSYGRENAYADAVRKAVKGKEHFEVIEDFIPPEEFQLFYEKISALVINGYRQMAGANIFSGIRNGAKIYLNKKNIFFTWLKNEGFQIFTLEDFEDDLKNDKLFLDKETAQQNLHQLIDFSERHNVQDFQKNIFSKLTEREKIQYDSPVQHSDNRSI